MDGLIALAVVVVLVVFARVVANQEARRSGPPQSTTKEAPTRLAHPLTPRLRLPYRRRAIGASRPRLAS